MKNYRIKGDQNGFSIEIEVTEVRGHLWWKKEVKSWNITNIFGGKRYWNQFVHQYYTSSPYFKTIEEAKEQIKKWNTPVKYHEVN
jgi:hypothetical protein